MNATSASRAEAHAASALHGAASIEPRVPVLLWDVPVRVFHWLAVLCFAGAWLTAESERWRLVHVTLGWTLGGLVAFRLVWGLVGTKPARFASFVRGPRAVWDHLRGLFAGHPQAHAGHNPAGAWAIVGLLSLALITVASGWASYESIGGEWLEDLHEGSANAMLMLVMVHVAGVVVSSGLQRQNLVAAMVTGRAPGTPADALRHAWTGLGALLLAAVLGFWAWQWASPPAAPLDPTQARSAKHGGADEDD